LNAFFHTFQECHRSNAKPPLSGGDFPDAGAQFFPGRSQVSVFSAGNANTHGGFSVDQPAIRQPLPNRLFEKLADHGHAFSNANLSDE
jgi:hypothetical protein